MSQFQVGTPPLRSAAALGQAPAAPSTLINTSLSVVRLWRGLISVSISSAAAFAGGGTRVYARLLTSVNGLQLAIAELSVNGPGEVANVSMPLDLGGYQIAVSDLVQWDFNNGTAPANLFAVASFVVHYSVP